MEQDLSHFYIEIALLLYYTPLQIRNLRDEEMRWY